VSVLADRFARGLRADSWDGGPMPSPGTPGSLSGSISSFGPQGLDLIPSRGEAVWATFRLIYLTNPWVYACVNLIAGTVSRMPIEVYSTDPTSGDPVLQRDDWPITPGRLNGGQYLDKLFDEPAGGISRQSLIRSTLIDRLVLGNGLWRILEGPGLPSGFQQVPWRGVRDIVPGSNGLPLFYKIATDLSPDRIQSAKTENVNAADVVHFGRGSDPELGVGISPLASCRSTLRLHDAVVRSLVSWFTNSMRPGGHIQVEKLTREKAREIREMIVEAYASPENAGKVLVTSGDWKDTQSTPNNSDVVELLQQSRQEICATYGVPELVLGILSGSRSAGNATTTIRSQYIRDTVGTWTGDIEGDIQAQLLPIAPSWQSLDVRFNMAEQLRPDLVELATSLKQIGDTLSVDERRKYLGEQPYREPWSEVPWSTPGSLPLDRAATGQASTVVPPPASDEQAARAGNGHDRDLDEDELAALQKEALT
jgi:HK97 family phage portal protein